MKSAYHQVPRTTAPENLCLDVIKAKLKDQLVDVLIDPGASDNSINERVVEELQIEGRRSAEQISRATTKAEAKIDGKAVINIDICGKMYRQVQLGLMSDIVPMSFWTKSSLDGIPKLLCIMEVRIILLEFR